MIPSAFILLHPLRIQLSTQTVSKDVTLTATARYDIVASDGTVQGNFVVLEHWISAPAKAGNYDVQATLISGPAPVGTLNTWLALSSTQGWSITNSAQNGTTRTCNLLIQIREHSTGTVKASATITLSATSEGLGG